MNKKLNKLIILILLVLLLSMEPFSLASVETPSDLPPTTPEETYPITTPTNLAPTATPEITKAPEETYESSRKDNEATKTKVEECPIRATIFSSRRDVMKPGEMVYLTSKIEGAEGYEILLQWQCDKGEGFEDVPGANEEQYSFEASIETLGYNWRLIVYYR